MSCDTTDQLVQNVTVPRGSNLTIRFLAKDPDGNLLDLTGAKAYLTARERYESVGAVIAKKNTAAGGDDTQALVILPQTGTTKGKVEYYLVPADTANRVLGSEFPYDARVVLVSGASYQVGIGTITVGNAVTKL